MSEVAVPVENTGHAFASPSKFANITLCPYCAKCCEGWISPSSEASKRGSLMHEAMYNDETLEGLNEEDKALVLSMREVCVEALKKQGADVMHEVKVNIADGNGNIVSFGTIDLLAIKGDTAMVIDLKFGSYPVPKASENLQLKGYVLGTFQRLPVKTVYALIVQPTPEVAINYDEAAVFDRENDYKKIQDEICSLIESARNATEADARPSPEACTFCNKDACAAYQNALRAGLMGYLECLETDSGPSMPAYELVEWCDRKLLQVKIAQKYLNDISKDLAVVIEKNGGSKNFTVQKECSVKKVDWEGVVKACNVPQDIIDQFTRVDKIKQFVKIKKGRAIYDRNSMPTNQKLLAKGEHADVS